MTIDCCAYFDGRRVHFYGFCYTKMEYDYLCCKENGLLPKKRTKKAKTVKELVISPVLKRKRLTLREAVFLKGLQKNEFGQAIERSKRWKLKCEENLKEIKRLRERLDKAERDVQYWKSEWAESVKILEGVVDRCQIFN